MLHRLELPTYESISHLEAKGGYAVKKYYRWPWKWFYRKKLEMLLSYLEDGRIYGSVLDFGCGKPKILGPSLDKIGLNVSYVDEGDKLPNCKFDVITCGSVLEFVTLEEVLPKLKKHLTRDGFMVVASPMSNWVTDLYLYFSGDKAIRNSHRNIIREAKKHFHIEDYKEWMGLYFSFKATL